MSPAELTISQLVQLYAPLAGLLVVVFWLGALSNRVKQLEKSAISGDRLTRVETQLEAAIASLERVSRELQGVHRWLANAATKRGRSGNIEDIMSAE